MNKLKAENFAARLAKPNLITKTDFDNKLKNLNRKINANKTKHLLVLNKWKKLQIFDSVYFRGKSYFAGNVAQLSYTKTKVEFNGSCLKQGKITYNHETIVNIYTLFMR